MNSWRPYLAFLRGSVQISLIYRFGFLFTILGNVLYMAVVYFLWRSIYATADTLHGLTFNETFLYVAVGSAVFILLKTYADWYISYEIREGIIAVYLVKPVDYQFYSLAGAMGGALISLAAITLPTAIMLFGVFRIPIQTGPGLVLFPVSLALAFFISFNFDFFVGVMGFYSESIWGTSITKEVIISIFSGALIPLQFFPEALQRILLVLPFQAIYHTPLMMLTRPNQGWETYAPMLGVQLLWALVTFAASRLFFNQAIKVLRVAGG